MLKRFELLILDYGGVYSFGATTAANNFNLIMENAFGRVPTDGERQKISEKSRLLGENRITTQEYIELLGQILSVPNLPTTQQFEDATLAVTNPPSLEMVELVKEVRQSGVKVSLLSDMYMFEVKRTRPWGRYDGFGYVALSSEAGMTKQNPEFFKNTLMHFDLSARKTLFVDDKVDNIEVAKSVGIMTLLADRQEYPDATKLADKIRYRLNAG